MNSCLYDCTVAHARFRPKAYRFSHRLFQFYLDLDELGQLDRTLRLFGRRRARPYSFDDRDHVDLGCGDAKENFRRYLAACGAPEPARLCLLTHVRTFGHVFNPVSFLIGFDAADRPSCAVAEVGNTFGELKPYFLGPETLRDGVFTARRPKHYYISPFMPLDVELDLRVGVPGERLDIRVDDHDAEGKLFVSSLVGRKIPLNDRNLFWHTVRFPWVTLQVIGWIHVHALRLWLKGVPHRAKETDPHLQKGVFREYRPRR